VFIILFVVVVVVVVVHLLLFVVLMIAPLDGGGGGRGSALAQRSPTNNFHVFLQIIWGNHEKSTQNFTPFCGTEAHFSSCEKHVDLPRHEVLPRRDPRSSKANDTRRSEI
jgi:hypothetical protein